MTLCGTAQKAKTVVRSARIRAAGRCVRAEFRIQIHAGPVGLDDGKFSRISKILHIIPRHLSRRYRSVGAVFVCFSRPTGKTEELVTMDR